MKLDKQMGGLIITLFFFSGACGLIYAVAWVHILRYFLGTPLFSILSILVTFLSGLALGSYIMGFYIDARSDPLKIYGVLEGAIGIYSILFPWMIQGAMSIYGFIYKNPRFPSYARPFLKYPIFNSILLIPPMLIGAVWPVMSKILVRGMDNLGRATGKIFGVNTLGGSFGVLITGFILIPYLGTNSTIYISASIDLMICILTFLIYKRIGSQGRIQEGSVTQKAQTQISIIPEKGKSYKGIKWIILTGYAVSALAVMAYLVIYLRFMIAFMDSYFYPLFLILSAFMLGLALGGTGLARFVDKREDPLLILGVIELIIGLSYMGILPLIDRFPILIASITGRFAHPFWPMRLTEFFLVFVVMLIPALLLGLSFPLVCRVCTEKVERIGKSVSAVFAANAFGSLTGVLLGGIFLVTWLGIKKGNMVAFWSHIFVGLFFLLLCHSISRITKAGLLLLSAGSFILFSFFLPLWDMPIFKTGPYRYAYYTNGSQPHIGLTQMEASKEKKEEIFYKQGFIADFTVTKEKKDISMCVNSKIECSTKRDLPARVLSGHLPLLLHAEPKDILIIGLGTGVTLGSAGQYPVRSIECIGVSRELIEAAGYFREFNNNALEDPRLKLINDDAVHYLLFTDNKYDVIISDPLSTLPDVIAGFFTREFFRVCMKRLKNSGIAAARLPVNGMKERTFKSVLHTWRDVFPFVNLWETDLGRDYLLIGSNQRIVWDYPLISDRLSKERISSDLLRISIKNPPSDLLSFYFMDEQGLDHYCMGSKIFTDDYALAESSGLRFRFAEKTESLLEEMGHYRGTGLFDPLLRLKGIDDYEAMEIKDEVEERLLGKRYLTGGYIDIIKAEPRDIILKGLKKALQVNPDDIKAIELYSDIVFKTVRDYIDKGQFDLALWALNETRGILSENPEALYLLGRVYYNMGLIDQAIAEYEKGAEYCPDDEKIHCDLGIAYLNKGWIDLSIGKFNHSIRINPKYEEPHLYLGVAYFKKGFIDRAIEEYENAICLRADYADARYNLGIAYLKLGLIDEAISEWKEVIRIRPNDINSRYNLAIAYYNHGQAAQSISLLEEALRIKPDFLQAKSFLKLLYSMRKE